MRIWPVHLLHNTEQNVANYTLLHKTKLNIANFITDRIEILASFLDSACAVKCSRKNLLASNSQCGTITSMAFRYQHYYYKSTFGIVQMQLASLRSLYARIQSRL